MLGRGGGGGAVGWITTRTCSKFEKAGSAPVRGPQP